jgi:plastocyanin
VLPRRFVWIFSVVTAILAPSALAHDMGAMEGMHGGFSSPLLGPGTTWSRTFDAVGSFSYHCHPHPSMTGTVVVADDATAGSNAAVNITGFAFVPHVLRVLPGTNVTWTNSDPQAHTVTQDEDTSSPMPAHGSPALGGVAAALILAALASRRHG